MKLFDLFKEPFVLAAEKSYLEIELEEETNRRKQAEKRFAELTTAIVEKCPSFKWADVDGKIIVFGITDQSESKRKQEEIKFLEDATKRNTEAMIKSGMFNCPTDIDYGELAYAAMHIAVQELEAIKEAERNLNETE